MVASRRIRGLEIRTKRVSNATGDKTSSRNKSCTNILIPPTIRTQQEKKNSNSIFRTTKRPNGFMTGWMIFSTSHSLKRPFVNKLRYRVDEAEEDRGQSKDDEDGLEVEDEDEDLRAGTKNQHGISYANSKEESEDEWDGIWRPEPTGGVSDEDTSQVPEFCVPSSASGA
ncbi:hypothetical protein HHX47_DHR7000432 [Lentinula edodes]|nr:hypothetical protein HHX47_DHR7000432 [Lentinula edodes]